jgi:hypothetical protein
MTRSSYDGQQEADMSETAAHDHELEVLEDDQNVPPRPEEQIADARDGADDELADHDLGEDDTPGP